LVDAVVAAATEEGEEEEVPAAGKPRFRSARLLLFLDIELDRLD
jgi:hypothetical protein